jgi:hypothetical protein
MIKLLGILIESRLEDYQELLKIIEMADSSIADPASRALENFTGTTFREPGNGIMFTETIDDAFSDSPSDIGKIIKKQLEEAFVPVKEKLIDIFGSFVPLHRYQRKDYDKSKKRYVLSYTLNKNVAKFFANASYDYESSLITDEEIDDALRKYKTNGTVTIRNRTYEKVDDRYYSIYSKEEYVTDGDDLEGELKELQKYYDEKYMEQQEKLGGIMSVAMPIDRVVWVTNRMRQNEFICLN